MIKNKWKTELRMNDKEVLQVRTSTKPECETTALTWSSICVEKVLENDEELAKEKIGEKVVQQIKSIKEEING